MPSFRYCLEPRPSLLTIDTLDFPDLEPAHHQISLQLTILYVISVIASESVIGPILTD
ncbi:hypothetical protein OG21DRAFT_1505612 [Imleria badia]|nr:hypothetical protein OG21DRAFT_1505612 [Imleria badia]